MTSRTERRQAERCHSFAEHGISHVRLRAGHDAHLVNAAPGGIQVETRTRLRPGSTVDLHLTCRDGVVKVRAGVVWCRVIEVQASHVVYRGAFQYDLAAAAAGSGPGYVVPSSGAAPFSTAGADATRSRV